MKDKINWICEYSKVNGPVDILNVAFVEAYIKNFNPKYIVIMFGANICRELGRMLSLAYKSGKMERSRISLIEHEVGFPNWVYVYELRKEKWE